MSRPPLYYEITRDGAVAIWRGPLDVIDLVHDLVEGRDSGAAVAGSIRRHIRRSPPRSSSCLLGQAARLGDLKQSLPPGALKVRSLLSTPSPCLCQADETTPVRLTNL